MTGLAAYDEALPFPAGDLALAERFADIRRQRPAADLTAVRDLVVVVSSSRGGSTLLAELLRKCPGVITLPGEMNSYVAVARSATDNRKRVLLDELAREVGRPAIRVDRRDIDEFAEACLWRLTAQWPELTVDIDHVGQWVLAALDDMPEDPWADDGAEFTCRLLQNVRQQLPAIDPTRYDLPVGMLHQFFPGARPVVAPPADVVVEMAPYRLFRPWQPATTRELATQPLAIVTPRNAYRLEFLSTLFVNARVRVVHLTRNPAAAVNGLLDGWRHHGFFAGRVDEELRIRGYTDVNPPWARHWWKFDLPPDWKPLAQRSLPEVAAVQWRDAHAAILEFLAARPTDTFTIRHEDVVARNERRTTTLRALGEWLGVDSDEMLRTAATGLRPVMATAPPSPARWRASGDRVAAALADPAVWDLVVRLGYGVDAAEWA